jgi:hypothetical protein
MSLNNPLDKRRRPSDGIEPLRTRSAATKSLDIADVHERIWSAIMDHSSNKTRLDLRSVFGARQ